VPYPGRDQERDMVRLHGHHTAMPKLEDFALEPVADLARLRRAREVIAAISLADDMVDYIVDIVRGTRQDQRLLCGASPRSANMLATAARVAAGLAGRDFVIPDDVKQLVVPALCHRLVMAPAAEIEGHTAETVLREIVDRIPAPR
jgi:MoxR-like ATPase